jgi:hypothetical protein
MDITTQFYLDQLAKTPNLRYKKSRVAYKQLKNEIYTYRSTAYLLRGTNIASYCRHQANIIERQLNDALGQQ